MIGRLTGRLLEKSPPGLVIDVHGVGYELEAPMSTFYALPATGESVALFTHLLVREDAQLLFGFASRAERSLFRALLKVNGVGAKVALSILSGLSVDDFLACVAQKDASALVRVPGIGKKTAERLLVEFQDRVESVSAGISAMPSADAESPHQQAMQALEALGYKPVEAKRLLDKSGSEGQSVEELIRAALKSASR